MSFAPIDRPDDTSDRYRPEFLSQLSRSPKLFPLPTPAQIAEAEQRRVERLSIDASGLYVNAVCIVFAPALATPVTALICALHDASDDDALTIDDKIVRFAGVRPRVDAIYLREKSTDELERERSQRADLLLEHAARFSAHENVPPLVLPQIWPFETLRVEKVPHKIDVERACLQADGDTRNVVNCPFYVAVHSLQAN